jgi:hypothetical protein
MMKVKLTLRKPHLGEGCRWELIGIDWPLVVVLNDRVYSTTQRAEQAAVRWAKKHNTEIVKESDA